MRKYVNSLCNGKMKLGNNIDFKSANQKSDKDSNVSKDLVSLFNRFNKVSS